MFKRHFHFIIFSSIIVFTLSASLVNELGAQSVDYLKVSNTLNELAKKDKFSGVVLIAENGKVKFEQAYGNLDNEKQIPNKSNTIFELASVSKQFTAMTIMMLQEKGLLNYDDLVEQYIHIPYKGITIRQLLTHTSGLPDYQNIMDQHWDKSKVANNKDIIEYLNKYAPPASFEPGTKYEYSNTGFVILASITEKVSGRDFIEFCNQEIFSKLKMKHTAIRTLEQKAVTPNFALGYMYVAERNKYVRADSFPSSNYTIWLGNRKGPGRISANLQDLLKWDQALYGNALVSANTLKEAYTPMTLLNGSISNYGFGWNLMLNAPNGKIVWHDGDNPGYKTLIVRFIDQQRTLIVLCNNATNEFVSLTNILRTAVAGEADTKK
jgi:CubicO group peptidase (beta-lactamase class C family)